MLARRQRGQVEACGGGGEDEGGTDAVTQLAGWLAGRLAGGALQQLPAAARRAGSARCVSLNLGLVFISTARWYANSCGRRRRRGIQGRGARWRAGGRSGRSSSGLRSHGWVDVFARDIGQFDRVLVGDAQHHLAGLQIPSRECAAAAGRAGLPDRDGDLRAGWGWGAVKQQEGVDAVPSGAVPTSQPSSTR